VISILVELLAAVRGVDATKIATRLYQGGAPPTGSAVRDAGFDVLVLCAREYQETDFPGVELIFCPLVDGPMTAEVWRTAVWAAYEVAKAVRASKRVLVTCVQGRNRSGLVNALALRMLYEMPGAAAVLLVKTVRKNALTNDAFVGALTAGG
jgi:hypothetical protein